MESLIEQLIIAVRDLSTPDSIVRYNLIINTLVAVGTVGATVFALGSAISKNTRHVDSAFVWESATSFKPRILIQNLSTRIIVIESIEIRYRNKRIFFVDVLSEDEYSDIAVLKPEEIKTADICSKYFASYEIERNSIIDHFINLLRLIKKDIPNAWERKHKLKIVIKLRNGIKGISKYRYSYKELTEKIFMQGLFEETLPK